MDGNSDELYTIEEVLEILERVNNRSIRNGARAQRPVLTFNEDGTPYRRFSSAYRAAQWFGTSFWNIRRAIEGKRPNMYHRSKGKYLLFEDEFNEDMLRTAMDAYFSSLRNNPVGKFSLSDGSVIDVYSSCREAFRENPDLHLSMRSFHRSMSAGNESGGITEEPAGYLLRPITMEEYNMLKWKGKAKE